MSNNESRPADAALTIVVTYADGSSERIEGGVDWDVRKDGHFIAWNDAGDALAERDNVATTHHEQSRGAAHE